LLHAARCPLQVSLHVVCCSVHVARGVAHVVWISSAARWRVDCCISPRCMLHASVSFSRRMLHAVCCLLHILQWCLARCLLRVVWSLWHCCPSNRVCCTFSAVCFLLHVLRSQLSVANRTLSVASCPFSWCPPQCPMPHGVRCLSPVPRRISSRCMFLRCESSVACCELHVPMSHVVRCLSILACCLLPVEPLTRSAVAHAAPSHTDSNPQSHTVTLATHTHPHLGLQQVSPATEVLNCERWRGCQRVRAIE
jgi:hypothetical protein